MLLMKVNNQRQQPITSANPDKLLQFPATLREGAQRVPLRKAMTINDLSQTEWHAV
jgi:hypothetical protein